MKPGVQVGREPPRAAQSSQLEACGFVPPPPGFPGRRWKPPSSRGVKLETRHQAEADGQAAADAFVLGLRHRAGGTVKPGPRKFSTRKKGAGQRCGIKRKAVG